MIVPDRGVIRNSGLYLAGVLGLSMLVAACEPPKGGPDTPAGGSGKPKIEIVGGETIDWGKQPPGTLKRTLKIVNTGGDTLRITDVHPSCGCTTAPLDKKALAFGDTAMVDVSIDMNSRTGPQHKTITITTNDSLRPTLQVELVADIVREVAVIPEVFPVIEDAKVGKEDSSAVFIINKSAEPVIVQPPLVTNPGSLAARFAMKSPQTMQPGDSLKIVVYAKALTASVVSGEVTINTSNKAIPVVKVPLTINATPKSSAEAGAIPKSIEVNPQAAGAVTPGKTPAGAASRK